MGKIYEFSGKPEQALAEYRRVVELNPVSVTAPYHIARIYERQGKYSEAEEAYKRVIARMPSFWLGYSGLGELYFNLGKFSEAAQQYQKVIDLMPSNPLGYEGAGAAYEQLGEYEKAIDVFKKGLGANPNAEVWSNLGAAYMFVGDNNKAAEAMQNAVELNPHNHMLWRNLGDSYRQVPSLAGRANESYQKALETAQQRLAVNPQDKYALSGMALYEAHLGRKTEALAYIDKTMRMAPNDPTVLFTVALAYEIIGDRSHALSLLGRSLDSGFSLEDVKREPELRALRSDPQYKQMLAKTKTHS
jgi:tetratricopeptide (TPR) repeat protein